MNLNIEELKVDRIYRGNRDIAVETYMPIKQGLYRGIKHSNDIENFNIVTKELKYRGIKYNNVA